MQQQTININTATSEEALNFLQSTLYNIKGLNIGLSVMEINTIFDKVRSGLVKPEEKKPEKETKHEQNQEHGQPIAAIEDCPKDESGGESGGAKGEDTPQNTG